MKTLCKSFVNAYIRFQTLSCVFKRFQTLSYAFIKCFHRFHMLSYTFIRLHTLTYAFIRIHYAFLCFYYAFTCIKPKVSQQQDRGSLVYRLYLRKPVKTIHLTGGQINDPSLGKIQLSLLPATPSSWYLTLEWLFELTLHPSISSVPWKRKVNYTRMF